MTRRVLHLIVCAALVAGAGALVAAQEGPPRPMRPGMGPGGPMGGMMPDAEGADVPQPVTGIPYSATSVVEMTQTLADGNRITRKTEGAVARDAAGRTRREHTLTGMGLMPIGPGGEGRTFVMIDDPTAQARYVLDPKARTARKMPAFSARAMRRALRGRFASPGGMGAPSSDAVPPLRESLGTKTIDGIEAEGTRTTVTIPAGQIGNEMPLEIVAERWYAPSLKTVIQSRFSDPRMGERTFRLTNIRKGDPPASLFQVPADYKIVVMPERGRNAPPPPAPPQ